MKIRPFIRIIPASALLLAASLFAQTTTRPTDPLATGLPLIVTPQQASQLAQTLLQDLRSDLAKLSEEFPAVSDIGKTPITSDAAPPPAPPSEITLALIYEKNVHEVRYQPDAQGRSRAQDVRRVVDPGGIRLALYLTERPLKIRTAATMPILYVDPGRHIALLYSIETSPDDWTLRRKVSDVLRQHVLHLLKTTASHPSLPALWPSREWIASNELRAFEKRMATLGDVDQLATLAKEAEDQWRDKDAEAYGRLVMDSYGVRGLTDPRGRRAGLAQSLVMRALEKADAMPLRLEYSLLRYVGTSDRDAQGNALTGETRTQWRKQMAILLLHLWQRCDRTIDPLWNPTDSSQVGYLGLEVGATALDYEDNSRKLRYSELQREAREYQENWPRLQEPILITIYAKDIDHLDELQSLLPTYISDAALRAEIIQAIKAKSTSTRTQPPPAPPTN